MTAGKFYSMTVLHVGGTSRQGLRIDVITPSGSKENPIPEEYLVAYQTGNCFSLKIINIINMGVTFIVVCAKCYKPCWAITPGFRRYVCWSFGLWNRDNNGSGFQPLVRRKTKTKVITLFFVQTLINQAKLESIS